MNLSKTKELLDSNSKTHGSLLDSGALGGIINGNAVRILDAENLKQGKFVRCEVGSIKPTGYGREIQWIDIPEINLQKAIKNSGSSGTHTRAIVGDGASVGDSHTVSIESYNSETHELNVIGHFMGRFTIKVPITYSSYENVDKYPFDNSSLRKNPTEPNNDEAVEQIRDFLRRNPSR